MYVQHYVLIAVQHVCVIVKAHLGRSQVYLHIYCTSYLSHTRVVVAFIIDIRTYTHMCISFEGFQQLRISLIFSQH